MKIATEELRKLADHANERLLRVMPIDADMIASIAAELITARAKMEAAEKMAEALAFYADKDCSGYDVMVTDYGLSMEKGAIVLDAGDTAIAALAAWEDVK